MTRRLGTHGGPDEGPEPLYDFSTNSNPLGPCPYTLTAAREADLTRYPDPGYTALRKTLAAHHDVSPRRVVIGAGASELILRLIRLTPGPVISLGPTFSEYERCAIVERRQHVQVRTPGDFLRLRKGHAGPGFVCWPNNPTGTKWPLDFISEAASQGPLAVDLAYAPLCSGGDLARVEAAARHAYRIYAPNKVYGLCGLRAGYLIAPMIRHGLDELAHAWIIDRSAESFIQATVQTDALRRLAPSLPVFSSWRDEMAAALNAAGLPVKVGPATYLMTQVGNATAVTRKLRGLGIRVRDATSFGMPEWIRVGCRPPQDQAVLVNCLPAVIASLRHS